MRPLFNPMPAFCTIVRTSPSAAHESWSVVTDSTVGDEVAAAAGADSGACAPFAVVDVAHPAKPAVRAAAPRTTLSAAIRVCERFMGWSISGAVMFYGSRATSVQSRRSLHNLTLSRLRALVSPKEGTDNPREALLLIYIVRRGRGGSRASGARYRCGRHSGVESLTPSGRAVHATTPRTQLTAARTTCCESS